MPPAKPYPTDCVVICAATTGTVRRSGIRGEPVIQHCADCQSELTVDSLTIAQAESMTERRGRPLRFYCVDCHGGYAIPEIQYLVDHRDPSVPQDLIRLDVCAQRIGWPERRLRHYCNAGRLSSWTLQGSRYCSLSAAELLAKQIDGARAHAGS